MTIKAGTSDVQIASNNHTVTSRIVNEELHVQILEAVLRECGRGNLAYQAVALESLGKILTASDYKSNYFKDIYHKLRTIILKVRKLDRR
jgi:hypothetical protein